MNEVYELGTMYKPTETDFIAYCHLEETPNPYGFLWVVDECPFCKDKHIHGAGNDLKETSSYLGHRVQHCTENHCQGFNGYVLIEDPKLIHLREKIEKDFEDDENNEMSIL